MKKIYLLFTVLILTFLISIPKVYAIETINYDVNNVFIINTQYIPTIGNQGDVELNTYTNLQTLLNMIDDDYTNETVFVNIPLRHNTVLTSYTGAVINYQYENIRTINIYIDNYVSQASSRAYFYLLDSKGELITSVYYTVISGSFVDMYLMTYTYDDEYRSGFNNGYQQGYDDSITQNYQPTYDLGYNAGYFQGFDEGILSDYSAWDDIMQGFFGPFNILNFELLPGFKIGYVFAFFMIIGVLSFLIGKRKA